MSAGFCRDVVHEVAQVRSVAVQTTSEELLRRFPVVQRMRFRVIVGVKDEQLGRVQVRLNCDLAVDVGETPIAVRRNLKHEW